MKFSRQQLKKLVKECLVEILQEGIGDVISQVRESRSRDTSQRSSKRSSEQLNRESQTQSIVEAARLAAGNDDVLASVLEDTARTTYQKTAQNFFSAGQETDTSGISQQPTHGLDAASLVIAESEPTEVFGEESVARWSNLVFGGKS